MIQESGLALVNACKDRVFIRHKVRLEGKTA
jgi:hypothetical protein